MKTACVLIGVGLIVIGLGTGLLAHTARVTALLVLGPPEVSDFDGLTPVGLQPGSPAGSYALSGLDTVNLYSGSANIAIPLLKIGGRGEAGYTMVANYDTHWEGLGSMDTCSLYQCPSWGFWMNPSRVGDYLYRPAGIGIRHMGQAVNTVTDTDGRQCESYSSTLTRISVGFADGSEMTLVDTATGGSPHGTPSCSARGTDRGTTFVSTDGSATTFVADN